jgi:hypothetical protein
MCHRTWPVSGAGRGRTLEGEGEEISAPAAEREGRSQGGTMREASDCRGVCAGAGRVRLGSGRTSTTARSAPVRCVSVSSSA